MMIGDRFGNRTDGIGGTLVDAFGRVRVSNPFTLFDSSHRFRDNNLFVTSNTASNTTVSG
jgi:hypothetical protein